MEKNKPPIVVKPSFEKTPSLESQLELLISLQEQSKSRELWKNEVEISIQTRGLPFMLLPLSDLHIGSKGVDYESLKKYLSFIKNNPVYTVLVGDLADNLSPVEHPDAMSENLVGPSEQWELIRTFLIEYQEKILALVGGGQHDEWVKKTTGIDIFRWLRENLNIPLLKSGGALQLKVDNQDYKIRLWHKIAGFNSQFNYTHAGKQAIRLTGDDTDFIITGDKHVGAVEQTFIGGKKRVICQLGTFKVEDSWGRSQGFVQEPKSFYPLFLFFSGQKNIEVIENLGQAEETIEMMKRYYKQSAVGMLGMKLKKYKKHNKNAKTLSNQ